MKPEYSRQNTKSLNRGTFYYFTTFLLLPYFAFGSFTLNPTPCQRWSQDLYLQFGNNISILFVGVGDSFNLALEIGKGICWRVFHGLVARLEIE